MKQRIEVGYLATAGYAVIQAVSENGERVVVAVLTDTAVEGLLNGSLMLELTEVED